MYNNKSGHTHNGHSDSNKNHAHNGHSESNNGNPNVTTVITHVNDGKNDVVIRNHPNSYQPSLNFIYHSANIQNRPGFPGQSSTHSPYNQQNRLGFPSQSSNHHGSSR